MKKCRYFPSDSQPLATADQMNILITAVREGKVKVAGTALRHLTGVWFMTTDEFIRAIRDHLEGGCKVFRKYERGSSVLLPNKLEASVWIREPDDENDYDDGTVYVEIVIQRQQVILICDSHEHERDMRRLPR